MPFSPFLAGFDGVEKLSYVALPLGLGIGA
jgi:hypothetical protein